MNSWFILSLVSAVGFGVVPLFLKVLTMSYSPQLVMAWYYSIVAIILWGVASMTTKLTVPTPSNILLVVVVSVIAAVADLAIFYAYKIASNGGYPRSVQAFSIVIATIIGAIAYRQFPSTAGIFGVILIFVGIVLLSGLK